MKSRYIPTAIALLLCTGPLGAEETLKKEITVERDVVPEIKAAVRPNLFPQPLQFNVKGKVPGYAEHTALAEVPSSFALLQPAATAPAVTPSPWRGYVTGAYGPLSNADLSAGYSVIADSLTTLNVWAQGANEAWRRRVMPNMEKGRFHRFAADAGVDFSRNFPAGNRLSASIDFGGSQVNTPWSVVSKILDTEEPIRNLSQFHANLSAIWEGGSAGAGYSAGIRSGIFNYTSGAGIDDEHPLAKFTDAPLHQTAFSVFGSFAKQVDRQSSFGAKLDVSLLGFNRYFPAAYCEVGDDVGDVNLPGKTVSNISLSPYYRLEKGVLSLRAGAKADLSFGCGKTLHVAPDVNLALNPRSGFGVWLGFGGGQTLNTLGRLQNFTPYFVPYAPLAISNIPVTGDLGLRFGPFKGAWLRLNIAYAAANDWLLPVCDKGNTIFAPSAENLRSFKAGVFLGWEYGSLLALDASFEARLGNDCKQVWYEWLDRARAVASAAVTVRPIAPLTVSVSWQLRTSRSMPNIPATEPDTFYPAEVKLRDASMLNATATYAITESVSVFVRGENLLNNSSLLVPLVPRQGVNGYIGASYKF